MRLTSCSLHLIIFNALLNVKALADLKYCGVQSVQPRPTRNSRTSLGGQRPIGDSWPWAAALLIKDNFGDLTVECSVTLINPNNNPTQSSIVLTSTHCLKNETKDMLVAFRAANLNEKEPNRILIPVASKMEHPDFSLPDRESRHVDLALLRLSTPVKFDEFIQPACLPNSKTDKISEANSCFTVGYGRLTDTNEKLKNGILQQMFLLATNNAYGDWDITAKNPIYGGICYGDSGSSLLCRKNDKWVAYGVLVGSIEPVECSKSEDWYSSTAYTLDWIKANSV